MYQATVKTSLFVKSTISQYKLLLALLFIILPIFDAINGYLVVRGVISAAGIASPSQFGRLIVSVFLVYIVLDKKLTISTLLPLFYMIIVETLSGFFHFNTYGFTYGILSGYKIGYLILLSIVLGFYTRKTEGVVQLGTFLKYNLLIISSLLYFSTFSGIGNSTYGFGFGTKSFFASGNGLGLYLGLSSLLLIGLRQQKLLNYDQKTIIYIVLSIALIGSKTALILCLLNLICLMLLSKYRSYFTLIFTAFLVLFLPEITEVFNTIFDVIILRLNNSDNILIYLASGRFDYVIDAFEQFSAGGVSPLRLMFGMGAYTSFQDPNKVQAFDTLETDLFDLLFMYGVVAVVLYLWIISFLLFKLRKFKIIFIGMLLLSLHSILAGHVLFNGMSSVCFALFYCIAKYLTINRREDVKEVY